jgi:hypothetical protein
MPTDVTLFDMLEDGILDGMSKQQVYAELQRIKVMYDAVYDYNMRVSRVYEKFPKE